ncbi:hypothetical protein [Streptomyces sp. NPDC057909]|uniref:hypothetical protein n=1 Tax=Streptomyces sp. NPDC057909 TaxID=3346277 RepID=UPI0036E62835
MLSGEVGDAAGWGLITDSGVSRAGLCRSGMAVPEISAGECAVQLGQVIGAVGQSEFRLIVPALEDAAPEDCSAHFWTLFVGFHTTFLHLRSRWRTWFPPFERWPSRLCG